MSKKLTLAVLGLLFSASIIAQNKITGKVTDISQNPIPYANVYLKGTNIGTVSKQDGSFELNDISSGSYRLIVSSVGFITKEDSIKLTDVDIHIPVILNENTESLGEIIVTANRSRETIDEVPSSVSVITSATLKELTQTSNTISDVLVHVPGIAFSTNKTSNTGQTLRGRNMLIMVDGIPQSTPLRNGGRDINTIDPNVIERVEIIKGATAIYGNGADGGIVNYITKKAKKGKSFESSTTFNTEGSLVDINESIGTSISQQFSGNTNKISYVASGNFKQTGVYRDADGEVLSPRYGLGETNIYNVFGKLQYNFNERNIIEGMYNYYSSNQNTNYVTQGGEYGVSPTIGVIGEVLGVDQGNRYNHNAQLKYTSLDFFMNTDLNLDVYFQDFKTVYGYSDYFYNDDEGYDGGQSQVISSKLGARLNLNTAYTLGENIQGSLIYGLDALSDKTAQNLVDGRSWVPEMSMRNFAPYIQLKAIIAGNFILKGGFRYENINIDIDDYQTIFIYPYGGDTPNGGVNVSGGKLKYNAPTFNVGLRYNEFAEFKPFVSFSQSFSIADLGRTLRSAQENTVSQIDSEAVIANNYELGFHSDFNRVKFSGAVFVSTSDLGSSYKEVDGVFQILRQPEKVYGFEFVYDIDLAKNLYTGGSFSYTEGKFDADDNGSYDDYINGDRIPPVKTTAYLQYKKNNVWDARLSAIFNGSRNRFDANDQGGYAYGQGPVKSFNLLNFNANYHLTPSTTIGLGIENLLNEDYYTPLSQWSARSTDYAKGNGTRFNLSLNFTL
ncbi:TonB-dependent receptor [Zhouia spongiae]|nr:TonB-dependent receptor [Zhouia spongiae]